MSVTRLIEVPRDRLWQAFTAAATFRRWWRPPGFTCPHAKFDVRPGGGYRVHMRSPRDTVHTFGGSYRTVAPPERLSYTWAFNEGPYQDIETVVEVRLDELGGATEVTVDQGPFPTERMKGDYQSGWENCLNELADLLEHGES
ncbi:MAG: SRPBCC family protein [Alphaproteobacteria bacterium]